MLLTVVLAAALSAAPAQQPPVPRPFPQPNTSQPARPPAGQPPAAPPATSAPTPQGAPATTPATAAKPAAADAPPTEAALGVQVYPGAQYLMSFDAGRGQRYYIYGSTASFNDLVQWYRTVLKQKGELVFESPATYEFDVGRFREESMAFPPGVTIKEYKSEISEGYPNPKPGAQPARFPTLIQVVPVTEK
jgi:hypothetical protein